MLPDQAIRIARPRDEPYMLAVERGLLLLITPTGSKLWRFRYRYGGRDNMLGLGSYRDTSLKLAREERDEARQLLVEGLDPSGQRQAEKAERKTTFELVAREWLALQDKETRAGHRHQDGVDIRVSRFPVHRH